MIDHQAALIYAMVIASAADSDMTDSEMSRIGEIVSHLPVFRSFDLNRLPEIASDCAVLLSDEDGLENAFEVMRGALPERLRETAYALACDVVAADGTAAQEELRLLEIMRHALDIDRLNAAAIERGAAARYAVS
ncbi:MAG: tellurite resistance TerB family protein [Proteobacteria bacterium]|nr:tellurite resistance TerB family protein [Pseudomonadota bacterium]